MRVLIFYLLFTSSALLGAEPWTRALELFSPFDSSGFVLPIDQANESRDIFEDEDAKLEEADESQSPLSIWSLNGKGFMHRGRRKAAPLDSNPVSLPQRTRIYTGGAGLIAVGASDRFYALLQAPSTLHAAQNAKGEWRWTLLEDRAHVRLSCHGEAPRIRWKDYGDEAWRELSLIPQPGSEVIIIRENGSLEIYQMQGRSRFYLPSALLKPARPPGLLRELQDMQLTAKADGRTRIELFPEQVLRLERKGEHFELLISGADPDLWGSRILSSSPQIQKEAVKNEKPDVAAVRALRLRILGERTRELTADEETLRSLVSRGRNEEALHLLRRSSQPSNEPLEAALLYRLQQSELAAPLLSKLSASDALRPMLEEEQRLSLLRANTMEASDLPRPNIKMLAPLLSAGQRYQLALGWQRLEARRRALDFWDLNALGEEAEVLKRSRDEWREHLLDDKVWNLQLALGLGKETNVLRNDQRADDTHSAEVSNRLDLEAEIERVFDRSKEHSVSLRFDLQGELYQNTKASDANRTLASFNLPLRLRGIFGPESELIAEPQLGRKMRGADSSLDFISYRMDLSFPLWDGRLAQSVRQMQSLDPAPEAQGLLDAETGERSPLTDQSVRKNELKTSWEEGALSHQALCSTIAFTYSSLDYRSGLLRDSDRQIFKLSLGLRKNWNLAWASELAIEGGATRFPESGSKASLQTMGEMRLRTIWKTQLRWEQALVLDYKQEASAYWGQPQRSILTLLETRYNY